MTDLRAADAAAREHALDVTRSFIVQAPAGAGKTELLTRRVLALLATVAEPESILAITFTRKAAGEMRDRIIGALQAANAATEDAVIHPRTLELARHALAADRARGWKLLEAPGRLRIQTIDALNLGLARRVPLLSGLGAGLDVEEDARDLYRRAAERLLAHLPHGRASDSQAVATLLGHVDNRVDRFVDLVVEMLSRREAWLPVLPGHVDGSDEAEALRSSLESARASLVRGHLAALLAALPADLLRDAADVATEAAANLAEAGRESLIRAWSGVRGLPDDAADSAPLWQGLAQLLLTEEGRPRARFDVRLGLPPGPEGQSLKRRAGLVAAGLSEHAGAVALLATVRRLPAPGYDAEEWCALLAQFRVLRLAAAELELVFAEARAADYPRFAAAARQALGAPEAPTDTALILDAELEHVLVDEFQDTSEAQVRLLESLTAGWLRGDGRTLFLVGDPMQSIYRFRSAEVGLFLDVRARGLGGIALEPLTLAVNFRSAVPVVEWVNACFAEVLPATDDVLSGTVRYSPCVARPEAPTAGGVRVHALLRRSRRHEAEQVVDIVRERLDADPRARVGILVQSRAHLIEVVAELAHRGIACRATDIDPLGERPAVLDLLALTRALAHPADRASWLAVLRAPWCGLMLADLHALVADDRRATVMELLRDPALRSRVGADARMRLERTWSLLEAACGELRRLGLRDTVERAWNALGGPATLASDRELDEVEAYFHTLADLEARRAGPVDLARLARALEALHAPSSAHPEVRVELLTVHKAKGLQFDTVIVPALERRLRRDEARLLHWMKLPFAGREELVVAPVARTGGEANPLYAWLDGLERERQQQERRRLLYVAATRAERWLHLFGSAQVQDDASPPTVRRPAQNTALGLLWPVVGHEFVRRLEESGTPPGEEAAETARSAPLRRLPPGWQVAGLPRAPRVESQAVPRVAQAPLVAFDWASETARHVGTVVHRELQRIARDGACPDPEQPRLQRRWADELAELGVPAERLIEAVERVADALRRTLADERGRWLLDASHRDSASELALTGRFGAEIVSVVIDRTFVDDRGVRWIVDYKTSRHEGAGLDEFLDREQDRYRPQLERYAALLRPLGPQPVRLGLYFPLLSQWREWSA